jgi:trypsin
MAYSTLLIFYLVVCNVDFISATIYSCDRDADCGCSKYDANVYKIVGGENSFPSSWGWAVSLQIFGSHFCTGSIVSPLHVITAAHCVTEDFVMKLTSVVVGIDRLSETDDSATVQVRSVSDAFIHPSYYYNDTEIVNDIAVLRLNESLAISSEMATARLCLPRVVPSGREADYPANSAMLVAIGWGKLEYEAPSIPSDLHLQQVTLKAVPVDDEMCAGFVTDPRSQFCAGVRGGGKGEKVHFHNIMKLFFIHHLDTC